MRAADQVRESTGPPVQRPDERTLPPWGYMVFESIGCATCHAPKLGEVTGLYSDLLLHDMGESSERFRHLLRRSGRAPELG